jgi:hypothetical protein
MRHNAIARLGLAVLTTLALSSLLPTSGEAAAFQRTVPFALDQWVDINFQDGPVTIHRLRVVRKSGIKGFKSVVTRPGHSEFLQDVQIQIEFSNGSSSDWKVKANITWLDPNAEVIDGYKGSEGLGDDDSHELVTMLFSTLKYGLTQARTLRIELEIEPD